MNLKLKLTRFSRPKLKRKAKFTAELTKHSKLGENLNNVSRIAHPRLWLLSVTACTQWIDK